MGRHIAESANNEPKSADFLLTYVTAWGVALLLCLAVHSKYFQNSFTTLKYNEMTVMTWSPNTLATSYKALSSFFILGKLLGLSPRANHTDRATAGCQRSYFQRLWIWVATWSA
jgi:hypothetical protein